MANRVTELPAPACGQPARRCRDDGQRGVEDAPVQQPVQPERQGVGQRCGQVAAAAFLQGDDGLAARSGVAAQREHRDVRVDAG